MKNCSDALDAHVGREGPEKPGFDLDTLRHYRLTNVAPGRPDRSDLLVDIVNPSHYGTNDA